MLKRNSLMTVGLSAVVRAASTFWARLRRGAVPNFGNALGSSSRVLINDQRAKSWLAAVNLWSSRAMVWSHAICWAGVKVPEYVPVFGAGKNSETKTEGAASLDWGITLPGNCVRVADPPDPCVERGS